MHLSRYISLCLLLLLAVETNSIVFSYIIFSFNRQVLAEEFCEKKAEDCNACCYFNKKLNNDTHEEKQKLTEIKLGDYLVEHLFFYPVSNTGTFLYKDYNNTSSGFYSEMYHPPEA